ncbi:hypothetical protein P8625_08675 [Tenacibaculum tangerinum]|uniref:Thioesterase domain-containing protein n=1 Tax=Tenacibaculum tangerinum TaxID=3038772 RepID=A0ABY8L6Q9_9FLAO|nr:hypothetical protein P8625_08675 [Tenacibaculum tangerinum]
MYGHSMGAIVGYLICKKIETLNIKKPLQLIVSGVKAPVYPRKEKIAHLSDSDFWNKILNFGGMPEDFDNCP